jgi:hypothetical protein
MQKILGRMAAGMTHSSTLHFYVCEMLLEESRPR